MEFQLDGPEAPSWNTLYKLMIGAIVPRPIAWVSTVNGAGQPNLAPFSFFTAGGANPPHLVFTTMTRGIDLSAKDTLRNIRDNGEFVVNIVTEDLADMMNITSGEYPAEVNEFERADLAMANSVMVKPPRVAASPIHFECRLAHLLPLGDEGVPGSGTLIVGRVVHVHVLDDVLYGGDKIDLEKLRPIGRLAGHAYTRVTDLFDIARPTSEVKKKPD